MNSDTKTCICLNSARLTLHTISFRLACTASPDLDQVKVLLCCTAEPNHGSRNMQAVNSSTLPLKQGTVISKSPMCPEATYTYYKHSTSFYDHTYRGNVWTNERTHSGIPTDEVYHERVSLSSLFWLNLAQRALVLNLFQIISFINCIIKLIKISLQQ